MYFFTRHFILDFAITQISLPVSLPIVLVGLYLLIRINLLLMLCVSTNLGDLNTVKTHRKGLDRARRTKLKAQ